MGAAPRTIRFTLNGRGVEARIEPHLSLVEVLREHFDLFGARESCAQGLCGCCTVLVNGNAVSSCLYLAAFADGAELLDEHPEPTDDQIRHYLSGNLCRCGAYPEIIQAVKLAARKTHSGLPLITEDQHS